jgi:hypothetical protein
LRLNMQPPLYLHEKNIQELCENIKPEDDHSKPVYCVHVLPCTKIFTRGRCSGEGAGTFT